MSAFPCDGLTVLDFSQVLAGPFAGRILAELGADVIKIESPRGDPTRMIAPKWDRGQSGLYTWANLAKRNVSIDLSREAVRELVLALVRRADVVIENFRPGVAERLGIGWQAVHAANPRVVMLSVSGYGNDSSRRDRGAYAPTIHAATGILDYAARKAGVPVHPTGDAGADLTTALHATIALLAALRNTERTGEGEHVELNLYDTLLTTYSETPFVLVEPEEARMDTLPFDAGHNGLMAVAGPPQHVWVELSRAFPEISDPAPPGADLPTKARLRRALVEHWMAVQASGDELVEKLEGAGLACAPVETLREALTGAYAVERELVSDVDDRQGGRRPMTRLPYRFSRSRVEARRPAPRRGEHNREVLAELLELDDARIRALEADGVLLSEPDARGQNE